MKTVRVLTLGCSKNTVDTEHLLASLPADRFDVRTEGGADVFLINTCGFIGDAKEESIDAIMEAVEAKKRGEIGELIVFGCLSQRYMNELPAEIPEVDAWFGAREIAPILKHLGVDEYKSTDRYIPEHKGYAYLKISEGCDRRCSYCAIPFIRGAHRSVPMEELEQEARKLVSTGVKELILIAQDTTFYGLDLYGKRCLAELIRRLSAIDGVEWIRIHYSYPADFPQDVLDEMANNPKVCKYLDIPLQHISDKVLDAMHRHVNGAWTRELISKLRKEVPGVVLRTTMIVGFPGEGEEDFDELLAFAREARFERLGAFTYSEEEGTYGAEHFSDDIPQNVKNSRYDALMSLQNPISLAFNQSRVGTVERVLVDDCVDGTLVCRSQYESPEVDGEILVKGEAEIGQFINVRIIGADDYDLIGEIVKEDHTVNLEKIIESKGGKLPGFVVNWMKKFLHLDFINEYLSEGREGVDFCTGALEHLDVKLDISGLENIPADGSLYTFVSNHPLGGIDGVALGSIVGRNFGGNVRYLVNDVLMNLKGLAPICVPVNKFGGQARNLPRLIDEAFHSENHMIVFPAGLCSRMIDGRIQDLPWGKMFINKSIETRRSVVPVHFIAQNSKRFYRIAAWCKRLGIKFNLAMITLPDEMYKSRHGSFKVVFGKPIPFTAFDKSRTPAGWAQWVREEVYKL